MLELWKKLKAAANQWQTCLRLGLFWYSVPSTRPVSSSTVQATDPKGHRRLHARWLIVVLMDDLLAPIQAALEGPIVGIKTRLELLG